jgi:hypothetical protein
LIPGAKPASTDNLTAASAVDYASRLVYGERRRDHEGQNCGRSVSGELKSQSSKITPANGCPLRHSSHVADDLNVQQQ